MSELKTLKDFENKKPYQDYVDMITELRQEAIKWIKHEEKGWTQSINGIEYDASPVIISWIKNFFNITDEELKA